MRLPFPERIPLFYVFSFAAVLCLTQMLEGTPAPFSLCSFLFIIIAGITFNAAGGFTRTTGSYVFFYAVLSVIIGLFWKAVLREPANTNLSAPQLTIEAYLGSMCAMLAAVLLSRKLALKRPLLGPILDNTRAQNATIGCMVVGLLLVVVLTFVPHPDGSFLAAIRQLDRFLPMAIIIGVIYQIRKSGGTSSVNLPIVVSFAVIFVSGVLGFSKEGMLTPFLCWLVAASSMRYRVSLLQIVGGILIAVFIFQFLVPYSQYGRNYRGTSLAHNFNASIDLLSNLGYVREQFREQEAEESQSNDIDYFNTPQGFFDRLQMFSMDDALINYTEQGHVFGLDPIWASFENMVPHFLWPNKPGLLYGNLFAREVGGIISEGDTDTGISFSPTGEGFHMARWGGIFIIAPIVWTMLFTLFESLCGDVRVAPWGLLLIPVYGHAAPEGGLTGSIYLLGYGALSIIFAALAAAYIMPIAGTLFAGPESVSVRRGARIRSVPRRANLTSSES